MSELGVQPHPIVLRCGRLFLPLFNRKPECIVNILSRGSGNQPVTLCLLSSVLPVCEM